jgi:hypothetical protein
MRFATITDAAFSDRSDSATKLQTLALHQGSYAAAPSSAARPVNVGGSNCTKDFPLFEIEVIHLEHFRWAFFLKLRGRRYLSIRRRFRKHAGVKACP